MGRSQTGNEGSPLKAWVWGRNRGLSSIRKTGLLLSFFFFILGAFYNILEQKDFLFSFYIFWLLFLMIAVREEDIPFVKSFKH